MQVGFDGQKHIFWLFLLCFRPHTSAGMNIKDALCKISWLWPATVCSIFTAIDAYYTHLDTLIPVLQQLQPWINTFIRLMRWKLSKIFFSQTEKAFCSVFFFFFSVFCWPCSPPWPTMPLWYVVWIGKRYLLTKGHAGSRNTPKN